MMNPNKLLRGTLILGCALVMMLAFAVQTSAQLTRSEVLVNGLVVASPPNPFVGENVLVYVDIGTYFLLNLNQRTTFAVEWDFGDGTTIRSHTLNGLSHNYSAAGRYTVMLRIFTSPLVIYTSRTTVNVTELPNPATIGTVGEQIAQFDINGDDRLGDNEFFAMIDAWVSGHLSDIVFFKAVDIWVADAKISTASAQAVKSTAFSAQAASSKNSVTFSAQGGVYDQIAIQIFNVHGDLIYTQRSGGSKLVWNTLSSSGAPVANGVYFYVLEATGPDGSVRGVPRAFALLR